MKSASAPLAAFLLGRGPPPALEVLRAARLGAYAYSILPEDHPLRPALKRDYISARVRHERVRSELVPLLSAWTEAGIPVLLFKGFHLSEFVYPEPGTRFHGDVDVLIPPEHTAEAKRLALLQGWVIDVVPDETAFANSHCAFCIYRPNGATVLDVHRRIIHSGMSWSRVPERITAAVWAGADRLEWKGLTIRAPQPVDALLVGLVLQRAWGDGGAIKPHDALDFRFIADRYGVTRADLLRRARELRCEGTALRFLHRFDPEAGRLELAAPTRVQTWWTDVVLSTERFPRQLERLRNYLIVMAQLPADLARALPTVLRMRRDASGDLDLPALLESLTPPGPAPEPPSPRRRLRLIRGVRWLTGRRAYISTRGSLVRSLALYAALRGDGWPVVFVAGTRPGREGGRHYTVELQSRVLPELLGSLVAHEVFRYPGTPPR